MFPKNRRIPRSMFPLLNGGKTCKSGIFLFRFVKNSGKGSRFCFSVSKKVSKSAVVRNRMRRAGYRMLGKHFLEIDTDILGLFSFREIPKNDEEIEKDEMSALKSFKLIK